MINRLPACFKQEVIDDAALRILRSICESHVDTVCQKAKCPNLNHCFKNSKITFMILGDACTRHCRFCAVKKSGNEILNIDVEQPHKIAELVKKLNLDYIVITSVTRDDLSDGGAAIFAKTIELIHGVDKNIDPVRNIKALGGKNKISNEVKVEVLIPDFNGSTDSLAVVIDVSPDVIAHNIETVKRLYKELRPEARYERSLNVLKSIKEMNPDLITKSSIMLGMGETEEEVIIALQDLRNTDCDILTLGQYLAPSKEHYPVKEFISIAQFLKYQEIAYVFGFKKVLSAPLVRSSYKAEDAYKEVLKSCSKRRYTQIARR